MHKCSKCKHELEYCEHCDIVYCKKCSQEWKKEIVGTFTYTDYPGFTYTTPNYCCNN